MSDQVQVAAVEKVLNQPAEQFPLPIDELVQAILEAQIYPQGVLLHG